MFVYDNIDAVFWHLRPNYLPARVKWFSLKCISVGSTLHGILLPYNIQGRIWGEGAGGAPPPGDNLRFSNTTGILQKKNYVVYWC